MHACWPTIRTGLLPFGEHWLAGSHGGGGIISVMTGSGGSWSGGHEARLTFGTGAAALLKAVWWGMRLASLLTHLFYFFDGISFHP